MREMFVECEMVDALRLSTLRESRLVGALRFPPYEGR